MSRKDRPFVALTLFRGRGLLVLVTPDEVSELKEEVSNENELYTIVIMKTQERYKVEGLAPAIAAQLSRMVIGLSESQAARSLQTTRPGPPARPGVRRTLESDPDLFDS